MRNLVYGRYEVVDKRDYRGHPQGTVFDARLESNAERRAIARGSITLLARVVPALEPGSYIFPEGWLAPSHIPPTEARASGSLS